MEPDELKALGLYDPGDVHAELRLALLDYVTALGATTEELVAYRDMLPALAGVLAIRSGPVMTLEEAAEASGVSTDEIRRLTRAAGFPDPEPGSRVFSDGFVAIAAGMTSFVAVFGEDAVYQLLRVLGSAMARVAEAVVSAFLVNVEPIARREDPVGLGVAHANVEAAALLPLMIPALDALLRQHLQVAQRTPLDDSDLVGYETQRLIVGFVDLVGSTELGEELSLRELGALLSKFEILATDTVTGGGGRVVKLIGDEIMYTAPDAASGGAIALDLARILRDDPAIPPFRIGLAGGLLMLRDGDVFGRVVNVAARAVKIAQPGEVVATSDVVAASGLRSESLGDHRLKGITDQVELYRLIRD